MILDKLENSDKCVISIDNDTWRVWYPLDGFIEDLDAANEVFAEHNFQMIGVPIKSSDTFKEDLIEPSTADHIKDTIGILRKRLDPNRPPRIPEFGMILEDDAHDW